MIQKYLSGSLSTETISLSISGLAKHLQGLKIVQLSDFHFDGLRLSERLLDQAIAASNKHQPDLVLLTGDYVTDDPQPIYELAQHLQNLQSRAGIYAVLGNHDLHRHNSQAEITGALGAVGIQVLWNQVAYPLGGDLAIIGLPDFWSKQFNPGLVLPQVSANTPRIVLSHNPDSAVKLQQWRVDLQLSGHTHGGQVVIPGIGPVMGKIKQLQASIPRSLKHLVPFWRGKCLKVVENWEWSEGLHKVGSNLLYINRGLGTYMPGRLFCPPELTVITLQG